MRIGSIGLLLAVLVIDPPPALGQTASGGNANPVSQSLRDNWNDARRNIKESADLMPEVSYSFRPVDSVRTFGQILAHVAGANYMFCGAAKGEKSPHGEDDFEKSATTRAAIIKALNDSLAYCDAAYAGFDDRKAGEPVEMPFGPGRGPRVAPLIANIGHVNEHYGNLVTYFRIKGIVPPSSRPR